MTTQRRSCIRCWCLCWIYFGSIWPLGCIDELVTTVLVKDKGQKMTKRNFWKDITNSWTYSQHTWMALVWSYEPWMLWRAACPRASRCWCVNLSNILSLCWPCHLRDKYCRIKLAYMSIGNSVECFNICLFNSNQEQCDGMFQLQSGMQRLILDACARLCYGCKMVAVQGLLASL